MNANKKSLEALSVKIGSKIRGLRKERKMTIQELAERTGLTKSLISQVETSKATPSLGSLLAMAKALGSTLGHFFEEGDDENGILVKKDGRKAVRTNSKVTYFLLSPDLRNKRVEFLYVVFERGGTTERLHSHEGEEYVLVLKGRVEIVFENESYMLEEGDSIFIDSQKPHLSRNGASGTSVAVWVNTPPSF